MDDLRRVQSYRESRASVFLQEVQRHGALALIAAGQHEPDRSEGLVGVFGFELGGEGVDKLIGLLPRQVYSAFQQGGGLFFAAH
jgi:hypothetical protein